MSLKGPAGAGELRKEIKKRAGGAIARVYSARERRGASNEGEDAAEDGRVEN